MKQIKESELTRKFWIEKISNRFEAGDPSALFSLLTAAISSDPDIPENIKTNIRSAIFDYEKGEAKTLDQAFRLEKFKVNIRRDRMYSGAIYIAVNKERDRLKKTGNPLKEDVFENVAEELNLDMKGSKIRDIYYMEKAILGEHVSEFEVIPD